MKLAVLFWFYKEFDLCANRLSLLRAANPGLSVYGLYGGDEKCSQEARQRLGHLLDDFYAFRGAGDARWRWQNGDRLLASWHIERGHALPWDTVVVVQWDMLLLDSVPRLFSMLQPGEALFSGLRPLSDVERWWPWARGRRRSDLLSFEKRLRKDYGYRDQIWCCLFIVVCLPRRFLELYAASGPPEEGFLEYKMPTMARLFGIPMCTSHPFEPWWAADPETRDAPNRTLNAVGAEVPLRAVLEEIASDERCGVIHPYQRPMPRWLMHQRIARFVLRWPALMAIARRIVTHEIL